MSGGKNLVLGISLLKIKCSEDRLLHGKLVFLGFDEFKNR